MHISDGILSPQVLMTGAAIAAAGIGYGLHTIKTEQIPKVGLISAAFFAAGLIHFPIGPASIHLTLNALTGLILGWASFPAIFVALFLQCLLGHGGFTTLGINTVIMAIPAIAAHLIFGKLIAKGSLGKISVLSFSGGAFTIIASSTILFVAISTTGEAFTEIAAAIALANIPLALLEGFVTMAAAGFIFKVRPELIPAGSTPNCG